MKKGKLRRIRPRHERFFSGDIRANKRHNVSAVISITQLGNGHFGKVKEKTVRIKIHLSPEN